MNTIEFFEIQASEPAKLKSFYGELFGWQFERQEAGPIEYWRIKTGSIDGGLLKRPAAVPGPEQGTNAFTCSIMVESFDDMAQNIEAHGGKVALPKFAVPGVCWQGYFVDPDGNTFGIFEPDENARS